MLFLLHLLLWETTRGKLENEGHAKSSNVVGLMGGVRRSRDSVSGGGSGDAVEFTERRRIGRRRTGWGLFAEEGIVSESISTTVTAFVLLLLYCNNLAGASDFPFSFINTNIFITPTTCTISGISKERMQLQYRRRRYKLAAPVG